MIYCNNNYLFQINKAKVQIPYEDGDIKIYRNGTDIMLKIRGHLEARFDGNNRARTCVSKRFNNIMTGLCGNMDGNNINDIKTREGRLVEDNPWGHIEIGDSWHILDEEDQK